MTAANVAYIGCNVTAGVILMVAMWAAVALDSSTRPRHPADAGYSRIFMHATCVLATALVFELSSVCACHSAAAQQLNKKSDFMRRRTLDARRMIYVYGVLCIAYAVMANGLGSWSFGNGGRPLQTVHFLAWALCLPGLLRLTSGARHRVDERLVAQSLPTVGLVACVAAGWLASIVGSSLGRKVLVLLACCCGGLGSLGRLLAAPDGRNLTMVAAQTAFFSIYGMVYLLGLSEAISPVNEQALFVMCDVLIALGHSLALTMARQIDDLADAQAFRFAVISHELRSPLHGIIGLSDMLAKEEKDPQRERKMKIVNSCAMRLLDLVENVSAVDPCTQRQLNCSMVNLTGVVDEVVCLVTNATDKMGSSLLRKGVRLITQIAEDLPPIEADAYRCTQLIYNLLTNACKFTKEGEITISACLEESGQCVQVVVADTGKGIAPDLFSRIFLPFECEDSPDAQRAGGVGLGLHIAREVAHEHGGDVTVRSQLGAGTTFTVRLPLQSGGDAFGEYGLCNERPDSPWAMPSDPDGGDSENDQIKGVSGKSFVSKAETDSRPGSGRAREKHDPDVQEQDGDDLVPDYSSYGTDISEAMKVRLNLPCRSRVDSSEAPVKKTKPVVLSVDDDSVNQTIIDMSLREEYEIHVAMDGQECLDFFSNNSRLPDVVLLDAKMPGMTGYEVCRALRNDYGFLPTLLPILMLSASADQSSVTEGLNVGCNDYVSKPFDPEVLQARVRNALQIKRLHSIEMENAKHTELLHSIMPPHIVERLKGGEQMISESHDSVTILFSDIVGWTNIAEALSTSQVVILLNDLFSAFDSLTEEHRVFKVETIGDAYMCAAGHDGSKDHAERIVRFGLAMVAATKQVRLPSGSGLQLQIRVGAHTGPAYTGVVGKKVPRYCFFGDTVNVSSRMESHGSPGCIHISQSTRNFLPSTSGGLASGVQIIDRGFMDIKGKGPMPTHLILPPGTPEPTLARPSRRSQRLATTRFQSEQGSSYQSMDSSPASEAAQIGRVMEDLRIAEERSSAMATRVEELEAKLASAHENEERLERLASKETVVQREESLRREPEADHQEQIHEAKALAAESESRCRALEAEVNALRAQLEASARVVQKPSVTIENMEVIGRDERCLQADVVGHCMAEVKSSASTATATDTPNAMGSLCYGEGTGNGPLLQLLLSKEKELEHTRAELQVRAKHLLLLKDALAGKTAEVEAMEVELAKLRVDLRLGANHRCSEAGYLQA